MVANPLVQPDTLFEGFLNRFPEHGYTVAAARRGFDGALATATLVQPSDCGNHDMTRPMPIAFCLALAALTFASGASAQAAPAATDPATQTAAAASAPPATGLKGDLTHGKQLTYTCQGCHGIKGYKNAYPNFHVPLIGGQSVVYLQNALGEYRKGERKHPTMQAQAASFSDQDIADIAAYLSSLKP